MLHNVAKCHIFRTWDFAGGFTDLSKSIKINARITRGYYLNARYDSTSSYSKQHIHILNYSISSLYDRLSLVLLPVTLSIYIPAITLFKWSLLSPDAKLPLCIILPVTSDTT